MRTIRTYPGYAPNPADQAGHSLDDLRKAASTCRACPLWEQATQTVFGEGPAHASILLIGEQPGDQEDIAGRPFVGPAGQILTRALAAAKIPRDQIYVTNAVKHFKFEYRGKRRLHKKPLDAEIAACHDWLRREIEFVAPRLLVAMGTTAVRSVLGKTTPIKHIRGKVLGYSQGIFLLVTVHPSFLLRVPVEDKDEEYRHFVNDLTLAEPVLA